MPEHGDYAQTTDTAPTNVAAADDRRPWVLFDGACPMCNREIRHYRHLRGAGALRWIDIGDERTPMPIDSIDRETAMARFHVRGADGHWHTGAFGFVEMWSHLPGYRHLARILRGLRAVGLLDRAYGHFARWRLKGRCDATSCGTTPKTHAGSPHS